MIGLVYMVHGSRDLMSTVVFILYAGVVAFVSLRPGMGSGVEHLDKVTHLLVYYIFAVLGYRALKGGRNYTYVCLGIIAYGGLLEVVQSYMPGRIMSGYDFMANTLGVVLGAVVVSRRK